MRRDDDICAHVSPANRARLEAIIADRGRSAVGRAEMCWRQSMALRANAIMKRARNPNPACGAGRSGHGTTTLFAALDMKSDLVIGECQPSHRAKGFIRLVQRRLSRPTQCRSPDPFVWIVRKLGKEHRSPRVHVTATT